MSIIKKLIENRNNVFCTSNLNDFYNHNGKVLKILPTNNEDRNSQELNLLIDTITSTADRYFQYFKFKIKNDNCVLLFSKARSKIHNFHKENYDFYNKIDLNHFPHIYDDTKLLCAIREFNSDTINNEGGILIHSFKNLSFLNKIDNIPALIEFSIYFSLNTWPTRTQKIIFFNSANNVIYLIDARNDMLLRDHDFVFVTKKNEYTYSFISSHTKRRGTSWDDDTTITGTFNFINNKWESFDVERESFKL